MKKPTSATHIEPAESRGQKRQTGVLSISSQSIKDLLDPQENGTSSTILSELSSDQEETVPFPLFGTNEERAFDLQNYALYQNAETRLGSSVPRCRCHSTHTFEFTAYRRR